MFRHDVIALALVFGLLAGCASIMHGKMQSVSISSTPEGATVTVDNRNIGTTPVSAELTRKDEHIVRISLEGYTTATLTLQRKTSGYVWGNIFFGGLIGLAVDAINGSMYKLEPEQLAATLVRDQSTALEDGKLYIVTVLHPRPDWVKIGQLETE